MFRNLQKKKKGKQNEIILLQFNNKLLKKNKMSVLYGFSNKAMALTKSCSALNTNLGLTALRCFSATPALSEKHE